MTQKREFRFSTAELKSAGSKAKPRISGYAARYGIKTQLQPGLSEVIMPGAFRATVARKDDCYACFNHDSQQILGRVRAGTLRLTEDAEGLHFDCDIDPEVSYANDLLRNISSGAVSECSFGFFADDDSLTDDENGLLRQLNACTVFDVSPVIQPAYSGTSVSARSRDMLFPQGMPEALEVRSKAARTMPAPVDVTEALRLATAKLALSRVQIY